jgi:hypothetical protein
MVLNARALTYFLYKLSRCELHESILDRKLHSSARELTLTSLCGLQERYMDRSLTWHTTSEHRPASLASHCESQERRPCQKKSYRYYCCCCYCCCCCCLSSWCYELEASGLQAGVQLCFLCRTSRERFDPYLHPAAVVKVVMVLEAQGSSCLASASLRAHACDCTPYFCPCSCSCFCFDCAHWHSIFASAAAASDAVPCSRLYPPDPCSCSCSDCARPHSIFAAAYLWWC